MFDFIKKKFSELKDSQDSKSLIQLLKLLAPLTDSMPMLLLIKDKHLNEKQKKFIRNNAFVWGYLNNLGAINSKLISRPTSNPKVLLAASYEIYSSMFFIDVETAEKEYTNMHKTIKQNKLFKEEFAKGAASSRIDMEEINIEIPNRLHPLSRLHKYLYDKYNEIKK